MRFTKWALLFGLILILSVSSVAAQQSTPKPRYTTGKCPFTPARNAKVECGSLIVPEDRNQPDGPTITLAVAVFKATGRTRQPDPFIYLTGGPGGNVVSSSSSLISFSLRPFNQDRDVIFLDQRGTGLSKPGLHCPNVDTGLTSGELIQEAAFADTLKHITACRENLIKKGVDVAAYTSAENAADVNDLRLALGYQKLNLYGVSYGTRLALTIMRDFPEGVRSAILDSTVPLQVDLKAGLAPNAVRAFDQLFAGCEADGYCNEKYPDLEKIFYQVVDDLNTEPIMLTAEQIGIGTRDMLLNGDMFVRIIFRMMYSTGSIPSLPRLIYQVYQGDYLTLARVVPLPPTRVSNRMLSVGFFYSIECSEEDAFTDKRAILAAAASLDDRVGKVFTATAQNELALCKIWKAKSLEAFENEPVKSNIPTLILAGQYDPITPPEYGKLTATTLSASYFFEFPGMGHGVLMSNKCPQDMSVAFIKNPATEPKSACMANLNPPLFR
jgi:pimeloyl-ACP methyl ester carboxylesterase